MNISHMELLTMGWQIANKTRKARGLVDERANSSVNIIQKETCVQISYDIIFSLFQAPREKREGEGEGRFRPLALSFARLSRSLEQAILFLTARQVFVQWLTSYSFFKQLGIT